MLRNTLILSNVDKRMIQKCLGLLKVICEGNLNFMFSVHFFIVHVIIYTSG